MFGVNFREGQKKIEIHISNWTVRKMMVRRQIHCGAHAEENHVPWEAQLWVSWEIQLIGWEEMVGTWEVERLNIKYLPEDLAEVYSPAHWYLTTSWMNVDSDAVFSCMSRWYPRYILKYILCVTVWEKHWKLLGSVTAFYHLWCLFKYISK